MTHKVPQPGQPIQPFISRTALWKDLLRMLDDYNSGKFTLGEGGKRTGNVPIIVKAATKLEKGGITQLSRRDNNYSDLSAKLTPHFDSNDPVWHSSIDNIVVLPQQIPAGQSLKVLANRFTMAKVTMVKETDRYAMVDPDNPTQLRSCDTGMFKIMADVEDDFAVVDQADGCPFWRFELTEDWDGETAEAKLQRWDDGTDFSTAVTTISDPTSVAREMSSGDNGVCVHVGNTFQVVGGIGGSGSAGPFHVFELTSDVTNGTPSTATADILDADDESTEIEADVTIHLNLEMFEDLETGSKGTAYKYDGQWYGVNAPCDNELPQWRNGSGAPSSGLGSVLDYYLDDDTGDTYKKTGASTWTQQGNIKGPQGDTGPTGPTGAAGANGADGTVWFNTSGTPSSGTGVADDWAFDPSTGNVYRAS